MQIFGCLNRKNPSDCPAISLEPHTYLIPCILKEDDRKICHMLDSEGAHGNNDRISCFVTVVLKLINNCYGWQVRRFFHSHFKVDRDLQSSVVVYSRRDVL